MVRSKSEAVIARRHDGNGSHEVPDELLIEEPLAIRLDGVLVASTMRTPGHDLELASGFLHAEGLLGDAEILQVRHCTGTDAASQAGNVVLVDTGCMAPPPTPRLGSTSSSCGICGVDAINELVDRLQPLAAYEPWNALSLLGLPDRAQPEQALFASTGASHAAAAFDRSGQLLVLREDIGRHNAVDKVVGRLMLDGQLAATADSALFVSGRASFEMVQKAWAAGFTALVAVSGPSALAVQTARRSGLTMFGFARGGSGTQYSPD